MTDIDTTLKTLRSRIEAAAARKARAQAEYERAEKDQAEALAALKEYGITTPDQAAARLEELETALSTELAAVEKALAEVEA